MHKIQRVKIAQTPLILGHAEPSVLTTFLLSCVYKIDSLRTHRSRGHWSMATNVQECAPLSFAALSGKNF